MIDFYEFPFPTKALKGSELQPTLVTRLGGTGNITLSCLKARYLNNFGPQVYNTINLLALDTADEVEEFEQMVRERFHKLSLEDNTRLATEYAKKPPTMGHRVSNNVIANPFEEHLLQSLRKMIEALIAGQSFMKEAVN